MIRVILGGIVLMAAITATIMGTIISAAVILALLK